MGGNKKMNVIAWRIIEGFINAVAILSVIIILFSDWKWKNYKELWQFGGIIFLLIFGALIIGKFVFPI